MNSNLNASNLIPRTRPLLLLAIAAVAFLLTPSLHAQIEATVKGVSGDVRASTPGAAFAPVKVGNTLPPGSRVRTGNDSRATLLLLTGTAIEVAANTEISVDTLTEKGEGRSAKRTGRISLSSGTISALIDPKRSRETDFKVQTPNGVAAARGTFYAVSVREGKSYVGVKKGRVGISADKEQ